MRPVFNLEPKFMVTMLAREEWTRCPGTPPLVKGLSGIRIGPSLRSGLVQGSMGNL
jgi:hypothetical protein